MRNFLLSLTVLLTGCTTVPVIPDFPNPVPDLMKKCEELKTIEGDNVPITDLLKTVVHNYTLYYQCSNKVDGWQEWYQKQKKIVDDIKK